MWAPAESGAAEVMAGEVVVKFWRWSRHWRWISLVVVTRWWRAWYVTLRVGRWIFTVDVSR